jgi:DNA-binding response OmpR family regulator
MDQSAADPVIHVLVVEDLQADALLVRTLLRRFEYAHFESDVAESMTAAVRRIQQGGIDAILLDLGLPDNSGFEGIETIRAVAPALPLIVVTGLADPGWGVRAIALGADDFVVKDRIDSQILGRLILRYIDLRGVPNVR